MAKICQTNRNDKIASMPSENSGQQLEKIIRRMTNSLIDCWLRSARYGPGQRGNSSLDPVIDSHRCCEQYNG